MTISSWLGEYAFTCPDPGILAYTRLDPDVQVVPRMVIWLGVLIALEQCTHAITLVMTWRRKIRFSIATTPEFVLPVGVALLWVVFTALSIVLVALTYRSNAAVLAKSLHVASEVTFLVLLCTAFGFYVFSSICIVALLIILMLVLTLPCSETITFAAVSGLVLDSINFLAYAWYGMTQPKDVLLWTLIAGFGWHVLYLLTYIGVVRWTSIADAARVWMRVAGLVCNIIASELILHASKRFLGLTQGGMLTISAWRESFTGLDKPLCVWTTDGLRLVGPVPDDDASRTLAPYEPHRTGYTKGNLHKAAFGLLPAFSSVQYARSGRTTTLKTSVLCAFRRQASVRDIQSIRERDVFVVSWNHVRYAWWGICVPLAIGVGMYP